MNRDNNVVKHLDLASWKLKPNNPRSSKSYLFVNFHFFILIIFAGNSFPPLRESDAMFMAEKVTILCSVNYHTC